MPVLDPDRDHLRELVRVLCDEGLAQSVNCAAVALMTMSTSSSARTAPFQTYMDRTAGTMFTQAACPPSSSTRASRSATAPAGQVDSTSRKSGFGKGLAPAQTDSTRARRRGPGRPGSEKKRRRDGAAP